MAEGKPPAAVRIDWMDAARGLAVVLVIMVHGGSIYDYFTRDLPLWIRQIGLAMAPYRIPFLVFLSGFLLPKSHGKGIAHFIEGKARNLAWPYVVWTILLAFSTGGPQMLLSHSIWTGGSYLWYIAFLMVFFAVSLVFRRLGWPVLAAYALAIAYVAPDGSKFGERLFLLMALFFAGGVAGEHKERFVQMLRHPLALAMVPMVVLLSAISITGYGSVAVNYAAEYAALLLAAIIGLCALCVRVGGTALMAPFRHVGRNSIVYYVVHIPIYMLLMRAGLLGLQLGAPLTIAVMMAAGLGTAALLVWARLRVPALGLLFVGPRLPARMMALVPHGR